MEGVFIMKKVCNNCGEEMEVTIRTLSFKRNLQIKNVPVYSCPSCERDELVDPIKPKIKKLTWKAERKEIDKKIIHFDKESELAQFVLMAYYDQEYSGNEHTIHEELHDLLDEMLLNGVTEDEWKDVIQNKLGKFVQ